MAYYRGDYYRGRGPARGDYYRRGRGGDPFWGALWGVAKSIGSALIGVGASRQTVATSGAAGVSGVTGAIASRTIPQAAARTLPGTAIQVAQRAIRSPTARAVAGGVAAGTLVEMGGRYYDSITGQPVGRRRRMNPANAKALRRSIRRVVGFGRLAARSKRAVGKAATALGCYRGRSRGRAFPRRRAS